MEEFIKKLQQLTDVACVDGTWNYDPYFHGMANALILALALAKGEDPKYLSTPKKWLKDKTTAPEDAITE